MDALNAKRKMIRIDLQIMMLVVTVLLFSQCTGGTTYYISSAGDDSAKGTSSSQAWRTIEKVNSLTLNPGDMILFEGGEVFQGSLKLDQGDSGSPENPVTITSYGSGRATISSGSEDGLYAENTSGIVVRDLVFKGAGVEVDVKFSGIHFYTVLDTVKPEFIRLENVDVSGYRWDAGLSIGQ